MVTTRRTINFAVWVAMLALVVLLSGPDQRLKVLVGMVPLGIVAFFAGEWYRSRRRARLQASAEGPGTCRGAS
jgi:uncharacterized protein (DUF58 family)